MPCIRVAPIALAALLASSASACARRATPGQLPRVGVTGSEPATVTATDSAEAVPISVASSVPIRGPITIRERPVTVDTLHGPPMYIVSGVVLGRRDDGTIDHAAAQRALGRLDPRSIAAIEVLRGQAAIQRFGPVASDGVVLIDLVSHAWRARTGNP